MGKHELVDCANAYTKTVIGKKSDAHDSKAVSYTHLRAHETSLHLVCRLLLEKNQNDKGERKNKI